MGEGRNGRICKVRKRGGSSSSSSSLVRTYRLKRALLVGKRGGSRTPVPMWKMKMMDASRSSTMSQNSTPNKYLEANGGDMRREFSVSARKLGATFWEINGISTAHSYNNDDNIDRGGGGWGNENLEKVKRRGKGDLKSPSNKLGSNSMALQLSDPSSSPVSPQGMERCHKVGSHRRRASTGSQKILQPDYPLHSSGLMEETQTRHRLKEARRGLTTSKELLKLLNRFWGLEEQQPACVSLFSALKSELDQATIQLTKAIQEHKGEIDFLLKRFEEERVKERERVQSAVESLVGELKTEKKLRKQTERLNKKLGRELANTKASLSKATKEAESEKRAREILEQACDELARGIGEDRAEVEELKKESAKVKEEVEKEREMLQLADVLREERVQMKLSEAKYEFEEKNAAIDELKSELEAFLRFRRGVGREGGGEESPNYERIKALEKHLRETLPLNGEKMRVEEEEDDDSGESDLHSIELNMDENSKRYEWSSKKTKGRKCISANSPICLERQTSEGIVLDFTENHKNGYSSHSFHSGWKRECEDEIERYNMIKDLRDHIVSSSKTTSSQDFISPAKVWSHHSFSSQDFSSMVGGDAFTVLQGTD
ncbi:unnamed protein product [Cuscuta epithymum]|uniref:Uncharacterized protein n=2 Tax=Cuscuta epithymum TaxID=186058 RepID=A0AAV0D9Y9_9ASTE|nr:unnamed protein product [Cuscuta epithymum]